MSNDRILSNAPLVEVVAEVHWALPGDTATTRHDPNWFKMAMQLEQAISSRLPVVEQLQPAGFVIPLDVLGRAPLIRFRPESGAWPLAQFGQGILTVNAVPPYDGWKAVRDLLSFVLEVSNRASPLFATVKPVRFKLMYRDAFTDEHGVQDANDFLINQIPLLNKSGLDTLGKLAGTSSEVNSAEIKAEISHMPGASISVRGYRGQINSPKGSKNAAIVDFAVDGSTKLTVIDVSTILSWFDAAHDVAWSTFTSLIPPAVMRRLKGE